MLEEAYNVPTTKKTNEIYQELSARTGVSHKDLKRIFGAFYDIISESMIEDTSHKVLFDNALQFYGYFTPEKISKNDNGDLEVTPEKMSIKVKLGNKIKYRIIDLYNKAKEFP